jgi:16S rRNA (cytidine1402-2'-O)-methyltransferase
MLRGEHNAALLGPIDADSGSTKTRVGTQAHLDEHQCRTMFANQIHFTTAHAVVAHQHPQTMGDEILGSEGFSGLARCGHRARLLCDAAGPRIGLPELSSSIMDDSLTFAPAQELPLALYVVATPLGNLGDLSPRALSVLRAVDVVACEDTRHSGKLLGHFGIRSRLIAVHEHNEEEGAGQLCDLLAAGKRVAMICDAGTPAVSDPGARVVGRARQAGFRVVPIPGPNAAIAALSAAGLQDSHFLFYGFLPARQAARRAEMENVKSQTCPLVFYESPHRVAETVSDMVAVLGRERKLVVARELTKLFESVEEMALGDAPDWFAADANRQRGEFVLIVTGAPAREGEEAFTEHALKILMAELPLKQAVQLTAKITGAARNSLYQRALELKGGSGGTED